MNFKNFRLLFKSILKFLARNASNEKTVLHGVTFLDACIPCM